MANIVNYYLIYWFTFNSCLPIKCKDGKPVDLEEKLVQSSNAMYVYQSIHVKLNSVAEIEKNKKRLVLTTLMN